MNHNETARFMELAHFKMGTKVHLKEVLNKHPIFLFVDGEDQPFGGYYDALNDKVSFAKINPVNALIYCISRRVGIDIFSDTLKHDLVEAIDTVLKNYNIDLEEVNGSNIQNKISGDGSPKS